MALSNSKVSSFSLAESIWLLGSLKLASRLMLRSAYCLKSADRRTSASPCAANFC
ncbi:Uncharacterised protein [Vibrio cholerae]|nr:Uncharacterised protein [Vibrio cholerae]